VFSNLVPVAGVIFLGWDVGQIVVLYWFENIIIGVLTLPRILSARGGEQAGGLNGNGALGSGCFFILHYGLFSIGHGVFTLVLLGKVSPVDAGDPDSDSGTGFLWALLAMAVLHTIAFVRDWVMEGRWRTATPTGEMFRPYGRIMVLHTTVLLGVWGMSELSAPTWTILVLCVTKAIMELAVEVIVGPVTQRRDRRPDERPSGGN
jgi:hypothetical protein